MGPGICVFVEGKTWKLPMYTRALNDAVITFELIVRNKLMQEYGFGVEYPFFQLTISGQVFSEVC